MYYRARTGGGRGESGAEDVDGNRGKVSSAESGQFGRVFVE